MKVVKFAAEAKTAYDKELPTPVKYAGEYEAFETIEEIRSANEMPKDSEIVKLRNAQRKAAARQKELKLALDAAGIVAPTIENDGQLRLKTMFDVLMVSGAYTEEQARQMAADMLKVEWED